MAIQKVILRVNQEYIHSAAQADEFRTEPPFRLQGSYRNMNRLAEKVVSIMNDNEVQALIVDHYRSESQTLTTGAEANLLKFKDMIGLQTAEEKARWDEIKKTFKRNQVTRGADQSDPVNRVVAQLSSFQEGLESIQQTLATQLSKPQPAPQVTLDLAPLGQSLEALREAVAQSVQRGAPGDGDLGKLAAQLGEGLAALRHDLSRAISAVHTGAMADKVNSLSHEMEMLHSTLATLKDMAARQRDHLRNTQELLEARAKQGIVEFQMTQEMMSNEQAFLEQFHKVLAERQQQRAAQSTGEKKPPADDAPKT